VSRRLLRRSATRLLLNFRCARIKLKTCASSMKVFARGTNQALARSRQPESTARRTMWSRPVKRRRNCRDTVMSLTARFASARRKLRHSTTPWSISKSEIRITETSSCKELKALTWTASMFLRSSVELPRRLYLRRGEISKLCRAVTMGLLES